MTLLTAPHLLDSKRWRGLRVGLLGGSFNPPHAGHVHISEVAMKRLGLDCIWWLVTPGNPLKAAQKDTLPYEQRLALCRKLIHNPRIVVSDLERQTGTVRTVETVRILKRNFPRTGFVLLAGMDLAHQLPRWYQWRVLPGLLPLAFIARPPHSSLIAANGPRMLAGKNQIMVERSGKPRLLPGNIFWILEGPTIEKSSTEIKNSNKIR